MLFLPSFVKNNEAVAMAIALFYASTHKLTFRITFFYINVSFSSYVLPEDKEKLKLIFLRFIW